MKRIAILIMLALGFGAATSYAQWTEIPALPGIFNWPMTAELNGTLYLFGGNNGPSVSNNVYTYKSGDTAWTKLTVTVPKAKLGGYAGVVNGKIYIIGGDVVSSNAYAADNTTYEFDPVAATFTVKKSIPVKTGFFAGATVGGKIYIINGAAVPFSGSDANNVQIYDPSADTWTLGTAPSFSNRLCASAVLNGNIYVMGGVKDNLQTFSDEVWKGVPSATDITWTQVASLPEANAQVSGGAADGKLVFTGGLNNTSPADYRNTYVYDPTADAWTTSYALPVATYNGCQMVGTGNDLYFAGGIGTRAFKFTVSNVQQPYAAMTLNNAFVNLSQNQTRQISYTVENFGVSGLTITIAVPDSVKSWLSATPPGTIDPEGNDVFTLNFASGTKNPGLYKTTVTVNSNDPLHTNIPLNVSLYVLPSTIKLQPTVVVLEEGTGNWCGYCPQGKEVAEGIRDTAAPGSIILLEYHGGSSSEPMMISSGQALINGLGIQGYPNAAIQRWFFPGEPYQMTNRGQWPLYANEVDVEQPDAPISINLTTYSFDPTTRKVHAVVELQRSHAMTNDPNSSIHLTTIVTEDGLDGQQEDYRLPSPYWTDYHWNDIVRQMYPSEFGATVSFPTPTLIDNNVIVPGDIVDVPVDLVVPTSIKPDSLKNCNINFIVNMIQGTSTLGPILQGQQRSLMGSLSAVNPSISSTFALEQNYPNPVMGETTINYSLRERSLVTVTLYDVLGREITRLVNATKDAGNYSLNFDASKLPSSSYIYVLTNGSNKLVGTMTVTK